MAEPVEQAAAAVIPPTFPAWLPRRAPSRPAVAPSNSTIAILKVSLRCRAVQVRRSVERIAPGRPRQQNEKLDLDPSLAPCETVQLHPKERSQMQIKGLGLAALMAISGAGRLRQRQQRRHGGSTGGGGTGSGKGGSPGSGTGASRERHGRHTGGGAFTTSVPAATKVTGLTTAQAPSSAATSTATSTAPSCRPSASPSSSLPGLEDAHLDLLENPAASNSELQTVCASDAQDGWLFRLRRWRRQRLRHFDRCPRRARRPWVTTPSASTISSDRRRAVLRLAPDCSTVTAASRKAVFEADGGSSFNPPEPTSCSKFDSTCDVDGGASAVSNMSRRMMPREDGVAWGRRADEGKVSRRCLSRA